jgi:hypothetical protein
VDEGSNPLILPDFLLFSEDARERVALLLQRDILGCFAGGNLWCRQTCQWTQFVAMGHASHDGFALLSAQQDDRVDIPRSQQLCLVSPNQKVGNSDDLPWVSAFLVQPGLVFWVSTAQNGQERRCSSTMLWCTNKFMKGIAT